MLQQLEKFNIILASKSPRRQQFLKESGIPFQVKTKEIEEVYPTHLQHSEITDYLSELKASAFVEELKENDILITSDTIVWNNNTALGKPKNATEAKAMLTSLSGKTHEVISSISLTTTKKQLTQHCITKVCFKSLTEAEIDYYITHYKPFDKAGAYGIQEWIGFIGITAIEGSYNSVVGLPTHLLYSGIEEIIR